MRPRVCAQLVVARDDVGGVEAVRVAAALDEPRLQVRRGLERAGEAAPALARTGGERAQPPAAQREERDDAIGLAVVDGGQHDDRPRLRGQKRPLHRSGRVVTHSSAVPADQARCRSASSTTTAT